MPGHVKALIEPWLAERGMAKQALAKRLGISKQRLSMELSNIPTTSGAIPVFNPTRCRETVRALDLGLEDARRLHLAAAADKGYEVL